MARIDRELYMWTAVCLGPRGHSVSLLALTVVLALNCPTGAAFSVSLELQGDCSDQLILICRHSDIEMAPLWIHNDTTVESGDALGTAFPGAVYTVQAVTEHTATITGVDAVRALDGYIIQCVYSILDNLTKSNTVKYSFIPPDYIPALSLVSVTADFSDRLSTFTYSYQESCSLYPRCTSYFSVEHTVSPQSVVSNSSSGCRVQYIIHNLMRCVSYQSTATTLIGNQRGNPIVMGDTVMLSPGQFTITNVSIGADRDIINVTYVENEPDCPGYPTERYTVGVDGVQVADLTADAVQSLAINHANGSVTLSLPLNQPLPENAMTLNMTKYNTVPTNRSDIMGNNVTKMVTWGTSAAHVFALQESPPGGETPAAVNDDDDAVVIRVSVSVGILVLLAGGGGGTAVIVGVIKWRNKKKKEVTISTANPQQEDTPGFAPTNEHDETPMDDHKWVTGAGRQLAKSQIKAGRHAAQRQHYAELDFAEERPIPAPPNDMFVVACVEIEIPTDDHEGAQMPTEETQKGDVRKLKDEVLGAKKREAIEAGWDAATTQGHHCSKLDSADERPTPYASK